MVAGIEVAGILEAKRDGCYMLAYCVIVTGRGITTHY